MSDQIESMQFHKQERRLKQIYQNVILFILVYQLLLFFDFISYGSYYELTYHVILDSSIVVGLRFYYSSLTTLIEKYHPERYAKIRKQMLFFYLLETIPLSLTIAHKADDIIILLGATSHD